MKNSVIIGFFVLVFCSANGQVPSQYTDVVDNLKSGKSDDGVTQEAKSNLSISIISPSAEIRAYYTDKTLREMSKGVLVDLYIEHLKVIVEKMPRIGLATKPGITMKDLGIPENTDNKRLLDLENEETQAYLDSSINFLRKMLPFADKNQLVVMILFYEQTLKALREVEQR
jgi:hypothetical protein